jgi:hypothetical protein
VIRRRWSSLNSLKSIVAPAITTKPSESAARVFGTILNTTPHV